MKRVHLTAAALLQTLMSAAVYAQQPAAPSATPGAAPAPGGNPYSMLIMFGMLFILFYFLILRPQKAEQRKREELLNSVAKGDQVLTSGGIFGTVESVDAAKGVIALNVAPKVSIRVSRSAVAQVVEKRRGGKDVEAEPIP